MKKRFIVKIYSYDPSSYRLLGIESKKFNSLEKAEEYVVRHYWRLAYDNEDTNLEEEEFITQNKFDDLVPYDTVGYEINQD